MPSALLSPDQTLINEHYARLEPGQSARVRLGQRIYTVAHTADGPQVHRCMPRSWLARAWTATLDLLSTCSLSTRAGLYEHTLVQQQRAFDGLKSELYAALQLAEAPIAHGAGPNMGACVSLDAVLAMKEQMHALEQLVQRLPTRANQMALTPLRERLARVATHSAEARAAIERGKQRAQQQLAINALLSGITEKIQQADVPLLNSKRPQLCQFDWPAEHRQAVLDDMAQLTVLVAQVPSAANQQRLADLKKELAAMVALADLHA